jgi:glycosyltransferase involved in cell wall biosynthesis
MPMFTVIIPTRDRPEFLGDAIASVLQQSQIDFELLIVNDGEKVVVDHGDDRIRILNNGMRGAVVARNLAVAEAKGELIAFLDDDDVWTDTSHLSRAFTELSTNCGFYFADGMMRYSNGTARAFAHDANALTLEHDNTILVSSVCYRKSLHAQLGRFDEALSYYWDWDWYLRVARAGIAIQRYAHSVVDIRVHAQNMSGNDSLIQRRTNLDQFCAKHSLGKITLKNHTDFV